MALLNAGTLEGLEAVLNEPVADGASAEAGMDGQVVDIAAATVMAAEDHAGEGAIDFGDETQSGITPEVLADLAGGICGAEADAVGLLPEGESLLVVVHGEKTDLDFHKVE